MVIKTKDKDSVIELRMEGDRVVIGELRRNAPMYENAIVVDMAVAQKIAKAIIEMCEED